MSDIVACPTCGEETAGPVCGSCGAELTELAAGSLPDRGERDQTASDQDQTWSDHDQAASARDQRSADEDQHAADDDFAAGGDALAYHRSARARERSSRDRKLVSTMRDETAAERLETAADRDRTADDRDREAELRDRGGAGRDSLARLHDLEEDAGASREDVLLRAQRDRHRAAADRAKAADDRQRAADDRRRAADDRTQAARERADAQRNQAEAADALAHATTDELTGAWVREFGLAEVARELERADRTGASLVLAFIAVEGLKEVNDKRGHLAGDALLRLIGETIRADTRSYDVLVRYGGDELLCAMPNITVGEAQERFEQIGAALTAAGASHSVTFGLAESEPGDSLQDVIGRADDTLLEARSSGS